ASGSCGCCTAGLTMSARERRRRRTATTRLLRPRGYGCGGSFWKKPGGRFGGCRWGEYHDLRGTRRRWN
ncbi:negative regulator of mitosis, partial [Aspergillus lentulus]